jgi:hypothetical protein
MHVNPLIRRPFANVGSRVDDASAAVIIIGTYALFLAALLALVSAYS